MEVTSNTNHVIDIDQVQKQKILIVGGGTSGIISAVVLQKRGHDVHVIDQGPGPGGHWQETYPQVRLQNRGVEYIMSEYPWKQETPPKHPTSVEVLKYWTDIVNENDLNIQYNTAVTKIDELTDTNYNWHVHLSDNTSEKFDVVIIAVGLFNHKLAAFPDVNKYNGNLITSRHIHSLDDAFKGKVVVVGFGKTAFDMAQFAADKGHDVDLIFRTPHWRIPIYMGGLIHHTYILYPRISAGTIPSWCHSTKTKRFVHTYMSWFVRFFWFMSALILTIQMYSFTLFKGKDSRARIRKIIPKKTTIPEDMRISQALLTNDLLRHIASGKVNPICDEFQGFTETGIISTNDVKYDGDTVVIAIGGNKPSFEYLPQKYQTIIEKDDDGVQLYRHILHPDIPNLFFSGYNHGFIHTNLCEIGAHWIDSVLEGSLVLPSKEEMHDAIKHIQEYKRKHIGYEPQRGCTTNTRYQSYLDVLMYDMGLNAFRKSNWFSEVFSRYVASDYAGIEQEREIAKQKEPVRHVLVKYKT